MGVGGRVLAEAVAFAVDEAAFHAGSGEDDRVALRPVVSAAGADVVDDRVRAADAWHAVRLPEAAATTDPAFQDRQCRALRGERSGRIVGSRSASRGLEVWFVSERERFCHEFTLFEKGVVIRSNPRGI